MGTIEEYYYSVLIEVYRFKYSKEVDKKANGVLSLGLYGGRMYRTGNANWQSRLFFVLIGLFFTWAVYYLVSGSIDPAYYWYLRAPASPAHAVGGPGSSDRILLPVDAETKVGSIRLIYKGKRDGCLLIDVLIPALDKGFVYHHAIPLEKAKHGFNLAGHTFMLIAVKKSAARISRLDAD